MKNTFRSAFLFILTLTIPANGQTRFQTVAATDEKSSAVDRFIGERMRDFHISDWSLVIGRDGKIVKTQSCGLANVESNSAATFPFWRRIACVNPDDRLSVIVSMNNIFTRNASRTTSRKCLCPI